MFGREREPTFPSPLFHLRYHRCCIVEHTQGSFMNAFTVSNVSIMERQRVVSLFSFPLVLPSSIKRGFFLGFFFFQLAFAGRTLPSSPLWLRPRVNVVPSAVTFSVLYPAPLFEVLSLPGFELPFVFYPAQCLSPELRLVWNCQSHRPHFNTGRSFFFFLFFFFFSL